MYKAGVEGILLCWMVFETKRVDETSLNVSAKTDENEIRKMRGIYRDRATVSSEGARHLRVGCPGSLEETVFQGGCEELCQILLIARERQSED